MPKINKTSEVILTLYFTKQTFFYPQVNEIFFKKITIFSFTFTCLQNKRLTVLKPTESELCQNIKSINFFLWAKQKKMKLLSSLLNVASTWKWWKKNNLLWQGRKMRAVISENSRIRMNLNVSRRTKANEPRKLLKSLKIAVMLWRSFVVRKSVVV